MLLAASEHLPYYIGASSLVVLAVVVGGIGILKPDFPGSDGLYKALGALTVVLVGGTMAAAIITGETPDLHQQRPDAKLGVVPQPADSSAASGTATK